MLAIVPSSVLMLLLTAGASAQAVFVVAPVPGPGVFSTDIHPAINAAAHGDLVLVKNSPGAIWIESCNVTGGNGAAPMPPTFPGGGAAPGINTSGAVTLLECTSLTGHGGNPAFPPPPPVVVGGAGSLQILPGVARHFATTSPVREGQSTTRTAGGVAGEWGGFLISASPGPVALLLPFEGAFTLSFASADGFTLGTIPAGGTLSTPIVVPNLRPAVQSTIFWCQSVTFDAPLTYAVIGPASAVILLDSTL